MRLLRLALLGLWAWFCLAFMTFEVGVVVNLVLGNLYFGVAWYRERKVSNEWMLAADEWEDIAMGWKADALSWQNIALSPLRKHTGRIQ